MEELTERTSESGFKDLIDRKEDIIRMDVIKLQKQVEDAEQITEITQQQSMLLSEQNIDFDKTQ